MGRYWAGNDGDDNVKVVITVTTVWHQPFPVQLEHVAGHLFISSDKTTNQRPKRETGSETVTDDDEDTKRGP